MALGKLDGVQDTNIGKAGVIASDNIGKIGGGSFSPVSYDSYTKLMLHMNGSNGSTTFTDEIGKTMTPYGGAKISTAQIKFGSASGLFDQSAGTYLSGGTNADYLFGSGNFTVDFWVRFISLDSTWYNQQALIGVWGDAGSYGWTISTFNNLGSIGFACSTTGSDYPIYVGSSNGVLTTGVWQHIAFVRNGSNFNLYVDGVSVCSVTDSSTLYNSTIDLRIGNTGNSATSYTQMLNGYIDELRISKGIARWTSNFVPPFFEYPTTSGNGRAVFAGGHTDDPSYQNVNIMDYINISTTGNATDFGDLLSAKRGGAGVSSPTRGVFGGFYSTTYENSIDYITLASLGNSSDFGDLSVTRYECGGCGSSTRGLFGGGAASGGQSNVIDYITIATTGNAQDFGDLSGDRDYAASFSSSTRGIFAGGYDNFVNNIDYVTIASTGNYTDFGDLTQGRSHTSGVSSSTRGVIAGGIISPWATFVNTIDYITIASAGNATDFGDLAQIRGMSGPASSSTRGVFAGGGTQSTPTYYLNMTYLTISTTGNSSNFGNLTIRRGYCAGVSDTHGGLS